MVYEVFHVLHCTLLWDPMHALLSFRIKRPIVHFISTINDKFFFASFPFLFEDTSRMSDFSVDCYDYLLLFLAYPKKVFFHLDFATVTTNRIGWRIFFRLLLVPCMSA